MTTRVVLLAAGKGKRMQSDLPKVLAPINGKPLIRFTLDAVEESGVDNHPIIVIGYKSEEVIKELGSSFQYVKQEEPLGSGHAVSKAREAIIGKADNVIVLYGDHPLIKGETINSLRNLHTEESPTITMMTAMLPDFDDWRSVFKSFGRVVRDGNNVKAIVESKDATEEELKICEVNPGYYCFDSEWLWKNLERIDNKNAAGEYYLTDLVKIAIGNGEEVLSAEIDPKEAVGVNTREELKIAEKLLLNR